MTTIHSSKDRSALTRGGRLLARALAAVVAAVRPGVTTAALDRVAETTLIKGGGRPAFKGYHGYPATLCASVNDVVVHGIPREDVVLADGDLVGLDLGVVVDGFYTDMAVTVGVGHVSREAEALRTTTAESLARGLATIRAGATVGDIGAAVQAWAEARGYGVVRDLVGHGVGRELHEEPQVPNFGRAGQGTRLREGLLLAVEPMLTLGRPAVTTDADGWTIRTKDHSLAAHFEQTIVVTERGCDILTPYGEAFRT